MIVTIRPQVQSDQINNLGLFSGLNGLVRSPRAKFASLMFVRILSFRLFKRINRIQHTGQVT